MKTTSSTSITSTIGVTLISAIVCSAVPGCRPTVAEAVLAMDQAFSSSWRDKIALNSAPKPQAVRRSGRKSVENLL